MGYVDALNVCAQLSPTRSRASIRLNEDVCEARIKHKNILFGGHWCYCLKADILALDLYVPFGPYAKLIESSCLHANWALIRGKKSSQRDAAFAVRVWPLFCRLRLRGVGRRFSNRTFARVKTTPNLENRSTAADYHRGGCDHYVADRGSSSAIDIDPTLRLAVVIVLIVFGVAVAFLGLEAFGRAE